MSAHDSLNAYDDSKGRGLACAATYGHSLAVCAFEAKMALFGAATRAGAAHDRHDDEAVARWRRCADQARDWLRRAHGDDEAQLSLGVAA